MPVCMFGARQPVDRDPCWRRHHDRCDRRRLFDHLFPEYQIMLGLRLQPCPHRLLPFNGARHTESPRPVRSGLQQAGVLR